MSPCNGNSVTAGTTAEWCHYVTCMLHREWHRVRAQKIFSECIKPHTRFPDSCSLCHAALLGCTCQSHPPPSRRTPQKFPEGRGPVWFCSPLLPGFKSQLCHTLATWPLIFWSLSFLICKRGLITIPRIMPIHTMATGLAYNRPSTAVSQEALLVDAR